MKRIVAQGIINLIFDVVDIPWHRSRDGPRIVDLEVDIECLYISGIFVNYSFNQTVVVLIIYKNSKLVLWIGLVVDTNLYEGIKVADSKCKRKDRVS